MNKKTATNFALGISFGLVVLFGLLLLTSNSGNKPSSESNTGSGSVADKNEDGEGISNGTVGTNDSAVCKFPLKDTGLKSTDHWKVVSNEPCAWFYVGERIRMSVPIGYRLDALNAHFCAGSDVPFDEATLWKLNDREICVTSYQNN